MPTHLPVKEETIELTENITDCDHIGDEVTWEYEYEPGSFFVKKYIRPKYARRGGNGVVIGTLTPSSMLLN